MTDDLLDIINLKNRHVEYNSRKTNLKTCQLISKRNKDNVKRLIIINYFKNTYLS